MIVRIFNTILICTLSVYACSAYAIGIEEVRCIGNETEGEYIVASGITTSDSCSVTDLAGNTRQNNSMIKSSMGSFVKLILNTNSFLNNTGREEFTLSCGEASITMSYENGACNNLTLINKIDGDTSTGGSEGEENSNNDGGSNTSSNFSSSKKDVEKKQMPVYFKSTVTVPPIIFAGLSYPFHVEIRKGGGNYDGEVVFRSGYYVWSFGDGGYKEYDRNTSPRHTYAHPGKYVLSFEYYADFFSFEEKANPTLSFRKEIEVLPVGITISGIDYAGGITIANNVGKEIDIAGWRISYDDKEFTFPHRSIILPNSPITISNGTSSLDIPYNASQVHLITREGAVAATYTFRPAARTASASTQEKNSTSGVNDERNMDEEDGEGLIYEYQSASIGESKRQDDTIIWVLVAGVSLLTLILLVLRNAIQKEV